MKFIWSRFLTDSIKNLYTLFVQPFVHRNTQLYSFVPRKSKIGSNVIIGKGCAINCVLNIGDFSSLNSNIRIDPFTKSIGKFCSISHHVKIGLGPHPQNFVTTNSALYGSGRNIIPKSIYNGFSATQKTIIGHDVLIGSSAIIMGGVKVGIGAIIGAGSVVTKDIPAYAIAVGVPAKVIKYRFDEDLREALISSKWWDIDINLLAEYYELIKSPREFIQKINNIKSNN